MCPSTKRVSGSDIAADLGLSHSPGLESSSVENTGTVGWSCCHSLRHLELYHLIPADTDTIRLSQQTENVKYKIFLVVVIHVENSIEGTVFTLYHTHTPLDEVLKGNTMRVSL